MSFTPVAELPEQVHLSSNDLPSMERGEIQTVVHEGRSWRVCTVLFAGPLIMTVSAVSGMLIWTGAGDNQSMEIAGKVLVGLAGAIYCIFNFSMLLAGSIPSARPIAFRLTQRNATPTPSSSEITSDTVTIPLVPLSQNTVEAPREYICPIGQGLLEKAVIDEFGHYYSEDAIKQWCLIKNTSPITTEQYITNILTSDPHMDNLIEQWKIDNPGYK
jgi:U-box domain